MTDTESVALPPSWVVRRDQRLSSNSTKRNALTYVIRTVRLPSFALGVCGDILIVLCKLTDWFDFSSSSGVIVLLAFAAMRFGCS